MSWTLPHILQLQGYNVQYLKLKRHSLVWLVLYFFALSHPQSAQESCRKAMKHAHAHTHTHNQPPPQLLQIPAARDSAGILR
ncbi:hypothetical protein I7I53_01997 [Histoplasma capsulatum var. duboisii H88]|uniref:Secreted protein n=1 Tax=Ajellomyces capsulatus (strain H88) TaxID=544711 RepID=A0A8A1LLW6_AJEC8|nr:hypothetical protein I7I53_01997 [Histoplasma capsulatum var. duboisii H88]